jgi:Mn-dependent transcriptional regulator
MIIRESLENYLKTIFILQKKQGQVRSIDIVRELDFSKPSVSVAIKKLRGEGLVNMDDDKSISLTEKGENYAVFVLERHAVIEKFLTDILNVDKETAHKDSCRIEHLISTETFTKIKESNEEIAKAAKLIII